ARHCVELYTSHSNTQSTSSSFNRNRSNNSKNQNQGNNCLSGCGLGSPNPLANILGPNGKLKPSKLERHKKNNLCVFCGGKHKTDDCNKRKKSAEAKGRAVTVTAPALTASNDKDKLGKA
ncbi:hypothetical protein V5O48_015949, partial [Marasmius crinis-equi]